MLLFAVAGYGLEDGQYYIRYSGKLECQKGKYLTYGSSCSSRGLTMSSRKSSKAVWTVTSGLDGMSLSVAGKGSSCRQDLSTKNTKCVSRWVGLNTNASTWKLKKYRSLLGDNYVLKSIKKSSKGSRCKTQVLTLSGSSCRKSKLVLGEDTKSERSRSKWDFVRVSQVNPPPPYSPEEMVNPPPPQQQYQPPPPPVTRQCAQQTPVYSHYDYPTSAGIRSVCEALWNLSDEYTLIDSLIGKEITCRQDSYESPTPTEWASPRPPVCDLLQQVASSDPRFDISDTIRDPCGLWFWCSNPAVGDQGLIVMQWNLQLQETYGPFSN